MEEEYGNVRFVNPENVTAFDVDGNEILCKCGKKAGCCLIGINSCINWCSDCSPLNKHEAHLVYRPPGESSEW